MNLKKSALGFLVGTVGIASLAPLSYAAPGTSEDQETKFYVGGNYGGFKARGGDFEDENDLIEGVLGVRVSPYFSVEGAYTYFGEFGDVADADLDGLSLAGAVRLPVSDTFGVYLKGGYLWWEADVEAGALDDSIDGEEPFYGAGVDFKVSDHVNLALEYLRYEVDLSDSDLPDAVDDYEADMDAVKVGAKFLF